MCQSSTPVVIRTVATVVSTEEGNTVMFLKYSLEEGRARRAAHDCGNKGGDEGTSGGGDEWTRRGRGEEGKRGEIEGSGDRWRNESMGGGPRALLGIQKRLRGSSSWPHHPVSLLLQRGRGTQQWLHCPSQSARGSGPANPYFLRGEHIFDQTMAGRRESACCGRFRRGEGGGGPRLTTLRVGGRG